MGDPISSVGSNGVYSIYAKADGTYVDRNGNKVNIGELLKKIKPQGAASDNSPQRVSAQNNFTYDGKDGRIVKYDDGTCVFQTTETKNGKTTVISYKFNSEKDIEKKKPSQQTVTVDGKKAATMNFEYSRNGKIKHKQTFNGDNVLLRDEEYNKDGKIKHRKMYNTNGELKADVEFNWTSATENEVKEYDKDHKLVFSGKNTYWDEEGKNVKTQNFYYPDGKKQMERECWENGKTKTQTTYYENGQIKSQSECWDNGNVKTQTRYDEQGNVTGTVSPEIDGNFGNSTQYGQGDCYLLSSINSIRELNGGQEMLKNLVQVSTNSSGEKVYTVTFPGAKLAAEGLKTDSRINPNKMYITGTYTFTESEMQEILKNAGSNYSLGDGDVILLEAAFEKYREEVNQTMKENGIKSSQTGTAGLQGGSDSNNVLYGGRSEDATFILTGHQSEVFQDYNVANGLDIASLQETGELNIVPRNRQKGGKIKAGVSEVSSQMTSSQKKLDEMLDKIMNDEQDGSKDFIATAGFKTIGKDGSEGGHAFTIKSVTADTVTLINPWHPDKEVTMTREEFKQCCMTMAISDTSQPAMSEDEVNPQNGTQPDSHPTVNPSNNPTVQNNPDNNHTENDTTKYTVKRGDNFWKIAKHDLEQKLGRKPTNSEIATRMQEIVKANGYKILPNGMTKPMLMPDAEIKL